MLLRRRSRCASLRREKHRPLHLEGLESRLVLSTFNVATEIALRADIMTADSNSSAANTINVTASITLTETTAGELEIQNATSTAKTLTIDGQASSPSATVIAGSSSWNTRIFEIAGAGGAGVTVVFKDLEITGGRAHNGGGPAGALGGGILIDGGQVTISNASIIGNHASGATGVNGAAGGIGLARRPRYRRRKRPRRRNLPGKRSVERDRLPGWLELCPRRQRGQWRRWR